MTTPNATPQNAQKRGFALLGHWHDVQPLPPALYIVSTPIGNLGDMTIRALQTLAGVDLILCEDTRTSAKLLDHFGIRGKRGALHDHNERQKAPQLVKDIQAGLSVALISDAGTPLLSDPGFPLVREMRQADVDIFAIPGASALLAGLAIAGLPTDCFTFVGFLPQKKMARQKQLSDLAQRAETLVFYESPRRISACLADMAEVFGPEREAVVAFELTKKFERSFAAPLEDLVAQFDGDAQKGEAVILVHGAPETNAEQGDWSAALAELLKTQPLKSAVAEITQAYGLKRKQVYDAALALKK